MPLMMMMGGWDTCVPRVGTHVSQPPKRVNLAFERALHLKTIKKIISVLNFTEKKHMKREQSVVLIQHHLIIISVSILRANWSLCDTWYQFAGGVVTVFDHFVVVCNTGRLCDEDSGEATALTRIIHPIHFIQPSRDSFTLGCPRKGFFQKSVDPLNTACVMV